VRQPLEVSHEAVSIVKRDTEYYIDPVGRASSLYSTLLNVGGENFRLIMVRVSSELVLPLRMSALTANRRPLFFPSIPSNHHITDANLCPDM